MTDFNYITYGVAGGLATLTINRPPFNVLDIPTMEEMNVALEQAKVATDIKRAITDLTDPPLAESTIAAKKAKAAYLGEKKAQAYADSGANPLIDTGHMRHSVTYKTTVLGQTEGPESVDGGE